MYVFYISRSLCLEFFINTGHYYARTARVKDTPKECFHLDPIGFTTILMRTHQIIIALMLLVSIVILDPGELACSWPGEAVRGTCPFMNSFHAFQKS